MPACVHLHVHSCYSFLEGLAEPTRLVKAAAEQRMPALALCDHLSLAGSIEFYLACQEAGIQPILGMEINLALPKSYSSTAPRLRQGALTLLAADMEGWSNLCRLTGLLLDRSENDSSTSCSLEQLAPHARGLICLSGGRRSLSNRLVLQGELESAQRLLHEIQDIFPDCFYAEIQLHQPEDRQNSRLVAGVARKIGLPLVAAQDIYAVSPGQEDLLRTLAAIRAVRPISELSPEQYPAAPAHFFSQAEMSQLFFDFPDALENTLEVASRCQLKLPTGIPHFPKVPLNKGKTASQQLRVEAEAGARRLYGRITQPIRDRLDKELAVIASMDFDPIFLIMQEVLTWARRNGVPVSSRGSAASSLVAHCLGITSPDPLRLNLYFERFLNPARKTPPDIDTDLCSRRRDLVIQHVFETYGMDQVAMVGTINRFRPRSALGDVAKAHGIPPSEVRQLTAALPYRFYRAQAEEDEDGDIPDSPYREAQEHFQGQRFQAIFRQAEALLGLPRHLSVHAGGIVITPGPVTDLLPVQRANKGVTITQLDHKMLEPMGVVKLDLLGIRGLTVLGDVADTIHSWRRSEYASLLDVLEDIPLEDPATSDRVLNGQTIGCFQIESPGMRSTLKQIHARNIEDIMVALALYRPGPLTGGLKDAFVRRHNNLEAVIHIHPALTSLLEDTYGVVLYQEQVLRIANEIGGFSLAESDLLRRAMSHFDPGKQMITLRDKFIEGAGQLHQVDKETAMRIWELMAAFAGYGFPKAHAASYALVGWRSAWCKTHFPAEFMAAVLANWGGYYSQSQYLLEARRMGLSVHPPHINHARREFSVTYPDGNPVLYMGLDQVRALTHAAQDRIMRLRPFHSLEEFMVKVNPRLEEASNLIRCGALAGIGTIPDLLEQLGQGSRSAGQLSLFGHEQLQAAAGDWSLEQRVHAQQEILGVSVDAHPLELVADQIHKAGAISTIEALEKVGKRVRVAGVRQSSHRGRTANGRSMVFLSFEDLEGLLDAIIFSDVYRRYRTVLLEGRPMLLEGTMEQEPGQEEPVLRVERVIRIQ